MEFHDDFQISYKVSPDGAPRIIEKPIYNNYSGYMDILSAVEQALDAKWHESHLDVEYRIFDGYELREHVGRDQLFELLNECYQHGRMKSKKRGMVQVMVRVPEPPEGYEVLNFMGAIADPAHLHWCTANEKWLPYEDINGMQDYFIARFQ